MRTTRDENDHPIYREKIKQMVMENKQSLEVDYQLLAKECHALAYFLPEVPTQVGFDCNQLFLHPKCTLREKNWYSTDFKTHKGP